MAATETDATIPPKENLLSRLCHSSEALECDTEQTFRETLNRLIQALEDEDGRSDAELQLQLLMMVVGSDLLDGCLRKFVLSLDFDSLLGCCQTVVAPALKLAQLCLDRLPSESLRVLGEPLQLMVAFVRAASRQLPNVKEVAELAIRLGDTMDRERAGQLLRQMASTEAEKEDLFPTENYRDLPVLPEAPRDLRLHLRDVSLRPNVTCGRYSSTERYLDTHYRLLREDFLESLRSVVRQVLEGPRHRQQRRLSSGYVYRNVRLLDRPVCHQDGVRHPILLDSESAAFRRIRWDSTKRLGHRSLLCFSSDNFQTAYYATVVNRSSDFLTTGELLVQWLARPQLEQLLDQRFVVVEPKAFYEGYRHVLQSLTELTPANLPFTQYLVRCQNDGIQEPKYLATNDHLVYNLAAHIDNPNHRHESLETVRIQDDSEWPTAEALALDASQYEALKAALRQEICLVQGPPGTGKTYIGLLITRLIMENAQKKLPNFGPILLVCYTNHALDQFLEYLVAQIGKGESQHITRVGSQSKSATLQHLLLSKKRTQEGNLGFMRMETKSICQSVDIVYKLQSIARFHIIDLHLAQINGKVSAFKLDVPELPQPLQSSSNLCRWVFGIEDWNPDAMPTINKAVAQSHFTDILAQVVSEEIGAMFKGLKKTVRRNKLYQHLDASVHDSSMRSYRRKANVDPFYELTMDAFVFDYTDGLVGRISRPEAELRARVNQALSSLDDETMSEEEEAASIKNVWRLGLQDRWRLYRLWRQRFLDNAELTMQQLMQDHETSTRHVAAEQQLIDDRILSDSKLVAMTTTAAARDRETLRRLKPKVVIIEEAAELLEAHVLACLNESCEHLILIGDHKQLRPSTSVLELASRYRLDVSLFERLVMNEFSCHTLSTQHRMRPEFSRLVRLIYPDLRDHTSVLNLPCVRGLASNLYFLNHTAPEERDEFLDSWSNEFEAEMAANLTAYLLMQGYSGNQITILTLYTGQLLLVQKLLRRSTLTSGVRACSCDNYQGEENDLVIVSLVRSNQDNSIGFLRAENRACVALSRARQGMIVLGNFRLLSATSRFWRRVWAEVRAQGSACSGPDLPLRCQPHGTERRVANPLDFLSYPHGGCDAPCTARLPRCGHSCPLRCHAADADHKHVRCERPCLNTCPEGHPCPNLCYERCHCNAKVVRQLPVCRHYQEMECHMDPVQFVCTVPCPIVCNLGHQCRGICGREHACCGYGRPCRLACPAGHECQGTCVDPSPCEVLMKLERPDCGHLQEVPCHQVNPRHYRDVFWWRLRKCAATSRHELPCGHTLMLACGQSSADLPCDLHDDGQQPKPAR